MNMTPIELIASAARDIQDLSKLRIYDPCSSRDLLHGIHLSSASLDKIDEKIKELYLNH